MYISYTINYTQTHSWFYNLTLKGKAFYDTSPKQSW